MDAAKIFALLLFFSPVVVSACPINAINQPYIHKTTHSFYYVVDVPFKSLTEAPHKNFPHVVAFQKDASARTNTDPYELLKKQSKFYADYPEEIRRYNQLIQKEVGSIKSLSCLEAFLFEGHLSQFNAKSEFLGFVLKQKNHSKIRVIVQTQGDSQSVSSDPAVELLLEKYLREGWQLQTHLHNHPFSFNNPYGDVSGTVIPSGPDINSYLFLIQNKGLELGAVTNGFHTLFLTKKELRDF